MSGEGDRKSVLKTTKVRTALKGDNSWIQRGQEANEEEKEEVKPWIAEVRATRSNGVFEETSPVSSPTTKLPQPTNNTEKAKAPTSGYLIRGVFTKTEAKPTSSSNGYAGVKTFTKKPSDSYKQIAPHTIRSSNETTLQSEASLNDEEIEKRKEAASSVLKGSAASRRSYVLSAAKKFDAPEIPQTSSQTSVAFVAKRVVISDDEDAVTSLPSKPQPRIKPASLVKDVPPETKPEPKPIPEPTTQLKTAVETKTAIEAKSSTTGTKSTTEVKPAIETKPVAQITTTGTKSTTEVKPAVETKPVAQTTTTGTKSTTEVKPAIETKPVAQITTTGTKSTTEVKPVVETKPVAQTTTTETKSTTEVKSAVETKYTTQTKTTTESKPTPEVKPVAQTTTTETKTTTEAKPAPETKPVAQTTITESKSTTQIKTTTEVRPTPEVQPVAETKSVTELKTTFESAAKVETKPAAELKPVTQTKTTTESKPTPEVKPWAETNFTTQTKTTTEVKTTSEVKPVAETKSTFQTKTTTESKPTPEVKPVAETKPVAQTTTTESKSTTQIKTTTEIKPTPEVKPLAETKSTTQTKTTTEVKSTSAAETKSTKTTPQIKVTESTPETSPESLTALSDTLISFKTEPARADPKQSSGVQNENLLDLWESKPELDLLSNDLLKDDSPLPNTKQTQKNLDLLMDDTIPFDSGATKFSTDYTYTRTSQVVKESRDFNSSNDSFDPFESTKSMSTDALVSLSEDVTPIKTTRRNWTVNMESTTSTKTEDRSEQKLPESESKKSFVYLKEYVNNSHLDNSSEYVTSATSSYNYSSPSYYSSREGSPCTYCGELMGNDKITLEHLNISCHPYCFKCGICSKPMGDLLYNMFLHRGTVHCESCYYNVL
ncbi:zinc finger protein 185 isoform X1 [Misgurnus anguillicaudatus]|uniref:zinc finger protein 185 isoform X1 n=1 Tax=Misgurnus anguillicaudatus TaxID=75329 RepID=UPI003CCFB6C3